MNVSISYPAAAATGTVVDAQQLERQFDQIGMAINSNARVTEGKTDLDFAVNKRVIYSEQRYGYTRCFGKHFSPIETSNASDTIYVTPTISDTDFQRVSFTGSQMAASAALHGNPPVLAYMHLVVQTGAGAGNVAMAPRTGAASDQLVVRPDLIYATNVLPSEGRHPFSLGSVTWNMSINFQYHAHVIIRLLPTTVLGVTTYYLQLRVGSNTIGTDGANERVSFKMTGWTM